MNNHCQYGQMNHRDEAFSLPVHTNNQTRGGFFFKKSHTSRFSAVRLEAKML
jgi:hypothetical protein